MKTSERVVVVAPLECKNTTDNTMFVTRIRELGLTAYGKTHEEAKQSLRKMFATFVELYRKTENLEERLNRSGLTWYYESEYRGDVPAESVKIDGSIEFIYPKKKDSMWQEMRELVVAH